MVRTVSPNAKETPSRPMPTFGNAAASTALPQPPKTSQNVPRHSAPTLLLRDIDTLLLSGHLGRFHQPGIVQNSHLQRPIPRSIHPGVTARKGPNFRG